MNLQYGCQRAHKACYSVHNCQRLIPVCALTVMFCEKILHWTNFRQRECACVWCFFSLSTQWPLCEYLVKLWWWAGFFFSSALGSPVLQNSFKHRDEHETRWLHVRLHDETDVSAPLPSYRQTRLCMDGLGSTHSQTDGEWDFNLNMARVFKWSN